MTKLNPGYFWQLLKTEIYNNHQLPTWMQPAKPLPRSFKLRHFKKRGLTLNILGLSPILNVWLSAEGNITVTANWAGECDFLYESELRAANDAQGYYCEWCLERRYYPQFLPLWYNHVLYSFINWCETNLFTADCILFFGSKTRPCEWYMARLAKQNNLKRNDYSYIWPLWLSSAVDSR